MRDVAAEAGVSQPVVSVVLTDRKSTVSVSDATRQRVRDAAERLGYRPNRTAQALLSGKSLLIGFAASELVAPWLHSVSLAGQHVLGEHGYSLVSFVHGHSLEKERIYLERSVDRRVDALIVLPTIGPRGETNASQLRELHETRLPIVQLLHDFVPGLPVVERDETASSRAAAERLLQAGHRRIVMVCDKRVDSDVPRAFDTLKRKREGFEQAMRGAGLEPRIVTYDGLAHEVSSAQVSGAFAACGEMAGAMFAADDRPTAVLTGNGFEALGMMRTLGPCGWRVPQDFSLVTCEDMQALALATPAISASRFGSGDIGRHAARMALDLALDRPTERITVACEFIDRGSIAPPGL